MNDPAHRRARSRVRGAILIAALVAGCQAGATPAPTPLATSAATSPTPTPTPNPVPSAGGPKAGPIAVAAGDGHSTRIYVMAIDGTNAVPVSAGTIDDWPSWSPDGTRILFGRRAALGTTSEIFVVNADGTGETRLTSGAFDITPAWSPDGAHFAFIRNDGGPTSSVMVANADGSNIVNTGAHSMISPTWSPDSSQIAYTDLDPTAGKNGANRIFVMNADGSGQHAIKTDICRPGGASSPDWAPDGSGIAFACQTEYGGLHWLAFVAPDGSGFRKLTADGAIAFGQVSWSPDSTRLAVSVAIKGIYVLDVATGSSASIGMAGQTTTGWVDWSP